MNQERKQSVLKKGKNAFPIISSLELYYLEMFILLRLILLYYFCYFLHNEKALSYRIIKCTKRKKFLIRVQERNAELLKKYFFPSSLFLSLSFSFSKRSQKKSSFPRKSKSNMLQAVGLHYFIDVENKPQNVSSNIAMGARSKKRKEQKLRFSSCVNPADRETRSKL